MKLKITFLTVLMFSFLQGVFGQKIFTAAAGNWNLATNWSPIGIPTVGDNVEIPIGKLVLLANPGAEANNLTISGILQVFAPGTLTVTNELHNDGTMTIISDASDNGSVIVGSYTGSGSSTYQRYLTGGDWHLISNPLSDGGITIADFITNHGAAMTQSGVKYSLATYDNQFVANGVSTWKNYSSDGSNPAPATSFTEAKGYEILMDANGTVDFTGGINVGPVTYTLTENLTGWNLVGNPFASSIYGNTNAHVTDNFLTTNVAQLDPSYVSMYIWNPTSGLYDIVNQATGSRALAPGQAFFVKSKTGGGTATFDNDMRTHQSANNFQKNASSEIPTINVTLDNNAGSVASTEVKYMAGTTLGLDAGYDAGQFGGAGTSKFNLYTELVQDNGVDFALQVVPDTDYENTIIPLGVNAKSGTQITFKATTSDLPSDEKVYIEDKVLNTFTEIDDSSKTHTVALSSNLTGTGRFYLHRTGQALSIDQYDVASSYVLAPSTDSGSMKLYGNVATNGSYIIFDAFGRNIYSANLQTGTEQNIKAPIKSAGIYMVKFNIDNKSFTKKVLWN